MSANDPLRLLSACMPPVASAELRERVLDAARASMAGAPRPTRADRIYFSTGWRLAWAGAAAVAVAVEILSSGPRAIAARPVAVPESRAAASELGFTAAGWMGDGVSVSSEPSIATKEIPL